MGVSEPLHNDIEKNFEIVPQLWGKASMDGTIPKLASIMDTNIKGVLGISVCNENEQWKYFIAAASNIPTDDSMEEYTIPAFTWAIFSGEGECPKAIQELEQKIVLEWLPTSGYEYDNGPDVEVYLNPDPKNAQFEVWIPVKKK